MGYGGSGYGLGGYGGAMAVLIVSQVAVISGTLTGQSMPVKIVLSPNSTQGIQVSGLQDAISQNYINVNSPSYSGAQLTLTLVDENGNAVPGCSGVQMTYVLGSNGNYQAVFGANENFSPPVGSGYTLIVDGNDGNGNSIHLEMITQIEPRQT
jgi:hypothetical protein